MFLLYLMHFAMMFPRLNCRKCGEDGKQKQRDEHKRESVGDLHLWIFLNECFEWKQVVSDSFYSSHDIGFKLQMYPSFF